MTGLCLFVRMMVCSFLLVLVLVSVVRAITPQGHESLSLATIPESEPSSSDSDSKIEVLRPSDRITLNFENADILSVIKFISKITGKNFLVDDKIKGTITILCPSEITVADVYQVFLSALEMKGFTVVESGKIIKIIPSREARYRDIPTIRGDCPGDVGERTKSSLKWQL